MCITFRGEPQIASFWIISTKICSRYLIRSEMLAFKFLTVIFWNTSFLLYVRFYCIDWALLQLSEEKKLDLLKNIAESSPHITAQDARHLLPSILQLLKVYMGCKNHPSSILCMLLCCLLIISYMPKRKTIDEFNYTFVEWLLYTFHQLANKVSIMVISY